MQGQDILTGKKENAIMYLSPDASPMKSSDAPPRVLVVGMLIDRRVQPNRSKDRASHVDLVAKRRRLEESFQGISANEPLNVDCIMEGMQQWWWNENDLIHRKDPESVTDHERKESFAQAASQAINHHAQCHPSRPVHLAIDSKNGNVG